MIPRKENSMTTSVLSYENGYPPQETVQKLYDEMDFQRACQAYMWSLPLVSAASIRHGLFNDLGAAYNDIVIYENFLDTRSIWFTGNTTTIYATAMIDLAKDGPVVVDVPAGPTAGMLNDYWWRTTGIGGLGPDKGNGGKFLILPPGYTKDLPKSGYFIVPSKMNDFMFFIRGMVINGDVPGASKMIEQCRIYTFSPKNNPNPNKYLHVSGKAINTIEPSGLEYWKRLSEVINSNPVEERDRFYLAMLKPLGIEKDKPFEPDERQKKILEEGERVGHAMAQVNSYEPRIADAQVYPGKNWMNVFTMNTTEGKQQEAENYSQLDERLHYLYLGTWPAQAMNLSYPSGGQRYLECFKDKNGNWLTGSKNYKLHIPSNVPATQFWSISVYDNLTRSLTPNNENKAAITSYDKLKTNADGSIDLTFGPKTIEGLENNWIDTKSSKGWFVWFRFYGPTEPFFNKTWQLPDFEPMN